MHFLQIIIYVMSKADQFLSSCLHCYSQGRHFSLFRGRKTKKIQFTANISDEFLVVYPKTYSHPANFHIVCLVFCIAGNRHEKCFIYPKNVLVTFFNKLFSPTKSGGKCPLPPK